MLRLATVFLLAGFGFTLLTAIADEPNKPKARQALSGLITFDGIPLSEGRILVHIADKQIIGCLVDEDGRYAINNPPCGTFPVTVDGSNVGDRYSQIDNGLKVEIGNRGSVINFELWHGDHSSSSSSPSSGNRAVPNSPDAQSGLLPFQSLQSDN